MILVCFFRHDRVLLVSITGTHRAVRASYGSRAQERKVKVCGMSELC
jgi:hypothetical protein